MIFIVLCVVQLTALCVSLVSQGKDEREPADESADERLRRRAYERGCQRLKKRIEGQTHVKLHDG